MLQTGRPERGQKIGRHPAGGRPTARADVWTHQPPLALPTHIVFGPLVLIEQFSIHSLHLHVHISALSLHSFLLLLFFSTRSTPCTSFLLLALLGLPVRGGRAAVIRARLGLLVRVACSASTPACRPPARRGSLQPPSLESRIPVGAPPGGPLRLHTGQRSRDPLRTTTPGGSPWLRAPSAPARAPRAPLCAAASMETRLLQRFPRSNPGGAPLAPGPLPWPGASCVGHRASRPSHSSSGHAPHRCARRLGPLVSRRHRPHPSPQMMCILLHQCCF
jgi:hypothetical protein